MTLADLLGCAVVDHRGANVGRVCDVRLRQDGPLLGGITAALRVDAVLLGRSGAAERLGYIHGGLTKPRLLRWVLRRFAGPMILVPWEGVEAWDPDAHQLVLRPDATTERI
jgi:hypothetical protein